MEVLGWRVWIWVCFWVVSFASSVAHAAVGRTVGEASVSDTGAAMYSVPLWTPSGINGVQPSLSLTYSSRNGNGSVGIGWLLDGLSIITRCPKTWVLDGVAQDVRNDGSDRFCLDGRQLKLVSGAYGSDGAEYRTDIESFARVRSYGVAGNGPKSFVVERKSGLILEYGATDDSRIEAVGLSTPHTWALNKISDRSGNSALFSYAEDAANGAYAISNIQYTQNANAGIAPHYEVSFAYEGKRAGSVDVKHDGALVRRYTLTYEPGTSRLASIQECASAEDCLSPTQFTYQSATAGLTAETSAAMSVPALSRPLALDVNGDGRSDLVYPSSPDAGKGAWVVTFADGSTRDTGISSTNWSSATPIDYNGDGLEDLLVPYAGGTWWVLLGSASGFSAPIDTGAPATHTKARAIDINGDGLQDLVWAELNGYAGGDAIRYRLRVAGAAFSAEQATIVGPLPPEEALSNVFGDDSRLPDFNGDGRGDITYQRTARSQTEGARSAASYLRGLVVYCPGGPVFATAVNSAGAHASFGDFNGDGRDDLIYFNGVYTVVRYSTGVTFSPEVGLPGSAQYAVFDWDGDGIDDVLTQAAATSEWNVIRSTGQGFAAPVSAGLSTPSEIVVADYNGDGLKDLAYSASGGWTAHLHAGVKADLLASATDGFGINASFAYARVAKLDVVRTLTASTGIASPATYVRTYSYSGPRADGFESRRVTDSRNGLVTQQFFRRDYPYVGMTSQVDELQPDGVTLISRTQNTLSSKTFGSSVEVRQFPFIEASTTDAYEVGGPRNGVWISRANVRIEVDDFGTPIRVVEATQDNDATSPGYGQVYVKTLIRQISNDTSSWCLGRSTQTTLESLSPDGTAATRTQGASIDSAACRIVEQVIEPASDTLRVTTRYGFDVCGNTNAIQTIGRNSDGSEIPTRTESVSYGARCQFPVSETNALAQTSTMSWDYALGTLTASADPNAVSTSWQYDAFGRLTREDRADRTYSIWTRSVSGLRRDDYATDGQMIKWQSVSLDAFDRPLSTARENAFGAIVEQRATYDEFGHVASSSTPFFANGGAPHFTTFRFDIAGRVTQTTREVSESDSTPLSASVSYEGLTTYTTDVEGRRSVRVANVLGQIVNSYDEKGYAQTFAYDPFGNVARVQDTLGRTLQANTYNVLGVRTTSVDVDMGTWMYATNSLGETASITDANANTTTITYDALSRPLTRVETDGGSAIRYSYKWDASGRLERAQVAGGSVRDSRQSFKYDAAGRLTQIKYSDIEGGSEYWVDQTFNPTTGLLDALIYPKSPLGYRLKLQYQYRNGELVRIADADNTFWLANEADAFGNATDETLGNGLRSTRKYDAVTGQLESIQTSSASGASIQSLTYHYDPIGNLIERQDLRQGLSERFFYDALNRLDYATLDGAISLNLTYDESGNITSKSGVGAYGYDATKIHALTSIDNESAFRYDANGNALGDPRTFTLSHYPSNLPKSANWIDGGYSSEFSYGPDERRFMQLAQFPKGNEEITYVGDLLEKSTSWKHYIFSPNGRAALYERKKDGSSETYYFTHDHLGSIDSITDVSGDPKLRLSYDAHGARRNELGWNGAVPDEDWRRIYSITHRGFTDHEMLDDLDVIHMNGRLYDPYSGRFISADPLIQSPTDTQSFNRYSYVRNNPLSAIDPTGFAEQNSHPQNGPPPNLANIIVTGNTLGWSGSVIYAHNTRTATIDYTAAVTGGHGSNRSNVPKPRPRVPRVEIDCSPGLLICDDTGPVKSWEGPQEEPLDGLWDDIFFLAESIPRVVTVIGVRAIANRIVGRAVADSTGGITNAVPRTLARVIPGDTVRPMLGSPSVSDVFVTAADDIAGLNATQLAQRLAIPANSRFTVIEFPTPVEGLASPVFRTNARFIGGGLTGGGAREFVIPNGPIPAGASVRFVGP